MNALLFLAATLTLSSPSTEFKCPVRGTLDGFEDRPVLVVDGEIVESSSESTWPTRDEVHQVHVICWVIEDRAFPGDRDGMANRKGGISTIHIVSTTPVQAAHSAMDEFVAAQTLYFQENGVFALTSFELAEVEFTDFSQLNFSSTDQGVVLVSTPGAPYRCRVDVTAGTLGDRVCQVNFAPASLQIAARWDAQQNSRGR